MLRLRLFVAGAVLQALLFASIPTEAHAATSVQHLSITGRDVAVWKPFGDAPRNGYPLVIFSHGFTGCNTQSTFLMEALARAGYLVVAPNHNDARCGTGTERGSLHPQDPFQDATAWSDATYRDRYKDIEAVLDAVLSKERFDGVPIDRNRVGIAGHSLGGYTALGMAGAWPSWKDPRIKAVLALSPYCSPYLDHSSLALGVPVMFQGGTLDFGITPFVRRPEGAFDQSSTPAFYMELDGAGHFAWTDLNPKFHSLIDTYSIAFFDRYLKSLSPDPLAPLLKSPYAGGISAARAK